VLALLYYSTNGEDWYDQSDFLLSSTGDECDWKVDDGQRGVFCNEETGRVENLKMWWNGMTGTIPDELSYLSDSITEINFSGGSITGTIPNSFEQMTNLRQLGLADNCLSGTIPEKIADISTMFSVVFYNNQNLISGNLNGFCNGTSLRGDLVHVSADCLVEGNDFDCDCCVCCDPNNFECYDLHTGSTWSTINFGVIPESFNKPCFSE